MSAPSTMDEEASIFALYLLMPPALFDPHLAKGYDLSDDQWLARTAKKFRVPLAAVAQRVALDADLRGDIV